MGKTFNTGYLQNIIQYDGSNNIILPSLIGTGTRIVVAAANGTLSSQTASTTNIAEGTNLYYTDGRVGTYLSTNNYATQSYVTTAIANLVASAPSTLDTLNELATALGNDPNFATTVATSIGTKQAQLNGTGFVKVSGTTVSYDNSTYALDSAVVKLTGSQTIAGTKTFSSQIITDIQVVSPAFKVQNSGNTSFYSMLLSYSNGTRIVGLPDKDGTIAMTSDIPTLSSLGGQPALSGTGFVKISGTTISYDNSTYLTTSSAASTYLPMTLSGSAYTVLINNQQFSIYGIPGGVYTSGRIIVDNLFAAVGYQTAGVFDGLKIDTSGNAFFTNSGTTRFYNSVRFDSTLTNGTYTYTLPSATGTLALTSNLSSYLPLSGGTLTGPLIGTSATFSTVLADYAMSISNVQDSSQGLLVRATDNDSNLYLLTLQSSGGATSQTWVDRFTVAKNGVATFSSTLRVGGATGNFLIDSYTTSKIGIRSWTDIAGTTNNFFVQNNASFNYGILGVVSANGTATGDVYGLGYSPSAGTSMTPVISWTSSGHVGINQQNPTGLGGPTFVVAGSGYPEVIVEKTGSNARKWGFTVGSDGSYLLRDYTSGANVFTVNTSGTPNFTNNITVGGNTVWTSANDGSGSGLDADLLDGRDSGGYMTQVQGGIEFLQGSYTGWYKLARSSQATNGAGGRGSFKIIVAATGNYLVPSQDEIKGFKDWGTTLSITSIESTKESIFQDYRLTYDADYTYLEGYVSYYFGGSQSIVINSYVNGLNGLTWSPYTGTVQASSTSSGALSIGKVNNGFTVPYLRSAGGVKFGSGSSTLNYYEEGTFTPTNIGSNFNGVTPVFGRYVRVGNQVTINCRWTVDAPAGKRYLVFNLPFSFFDSGNVSYTGAVSNYNSGVSSYSSNVGTSVRNSSSSTTQQYVEAVYTSSDGANTLLFSMTYFTF